jgi:hypothetical protein
MGLLGPASHNAAVLITPAFIITYVRGSFLGEHANLASRELADQTDTKLQSVDVPRTS